MATKQTKSLEAIKADAERTFTELKEAQAKVEAANKARQEAAYRAKPGRDFSDDTVLMERFALDLAVLEADEAAYYAFSAARAAVNAYDMARGDADAITADWANTLADIRTIKAEASPTTVDAEVRKRCALANEANDRLDARRMAEGLVQPRGAFGPSQGVDFESGLLEREAKLAAPVQFPRAFQLHKLRREITQLQASLQRRYLEEKDRARILAEAKEQSRRDEEAKAARRRKEVEAERAKAEAAQAEELKLAADFRARTGLDPAREGTGATAREQERGVA